MSTPSQWTRIVAENPNHSRWYVERFRTMAAQGADIVGEARFVDVLAPRGARILDAGCGSGRHCGALHEAGHDVVGVDGDAVLIEAAGQDYPGPLYLVGDLSELDLPARGVAGEFDVVLCAGNVVTFLHPSTRVEVLRRLRAHLAPTGRLVVGFGVGREYEREEFLADVETAGLNVDLLLGTWDLRPLTEESDFTVAVLSARD